MMTTTDASAAQTHIATLARPFVNQEALDAAGLRRGQWVVCDGQIGILTACGDVVIEEAVYSDEGPDGSTELLKPAVIGLRATVTMVKPDGTTLMELVQDQAAPALRVVAIAAVRTAYIEEVPVSRHEGEDHLRSLGYISASESAQ